MFVDILPCRFLWLLLIIGFTCSFAYLVALKVIYLISYPKNVDLSVEFKHTLEFPAVTICNNNYLRYTLAIPYSTYASTFFYSPSIRKGVRSEDLTPDDKLWSDRGRPW